MGLDGRRVERGSCQAGPEPEAREHGLDHAVEFGVDVIDLSAGAAKKLGFYERGTARVLVETVQLEG